MRCKRASAALAGAAVLLAVGCGEYDPLSGSRSQRYEDRSNALVLRYCSYGSGSVPALEECIARVDAGDVRSDRTSAGRYAIGEFDRCREDSGPYCGRVGP